MSKKRGKAATYYQIIFDQKVVAVYKLSEETPALKRMAALVDCYKHPATEEDYNLFLQAQKQLLRPKAPPR